MGAILEYFQAATALPTLNMLWFCPRKQKAHRQLALAMGSCTGFKLLAEQLSHASVRTSTTTTTTLALRLLGKAHTLTYPRNSTPWVSTLLIMENLD